ncbi:Poly [ADP-ribose] polymerase 2 [Lamellibrachia satsuma]|nr:Poly [ADP-ribose] polymerase 2 [Lamellibrachia satsuma]
MPRKKRNAEAAPTASVKKARLSVEPPCLNNIAVQWEYEERKGQWIIYPPEHDQVLTTAFAAGEVEETVDIKDRISMKVNFEKMTQKNTRTGWEKRVRCAIKGAKDTGDYQIWQWQGEGNEWTAYTARACVDLQQGLVNKSASVALKAREIMYTVKLGLEPWQQTNDETGVSRKVTQVKSDAVAAPPSAPSANSSAAVGSVKANANGSKVKAASSNVKVTNGSAAGARGSGSKSTIKKEEGGKSVKTVVVKGKAPVDPECTAKLKVAHVYYEGNDVYDVMLNQTNLSNNNNKYYLIQLLQDDNRKQYSVWLRWGRVGMKGQNNLVACGPDLDEAKEIFCKKFSDKTKNDWSTRNKFEKIPGKYDMVKLDYATENSVEQKKPARPGKTQKSKLHPKLQALINLICDVKTMEDAVLEMKYDAEKTPLGKLTQGQIKAGYSALKKIDTCVRKGDFGRSLIEACNEFYTRIPHNFGMQRPPVIRTKEVVKAKMNLLETLEDIEVAMKIIKSASTTENPLDSQYNSLNCPLQPMEPTDQMCKVIEEYLQNTHAATHNQYSMQIEEIYSINKDSEKDNFQDYGNRKLLWHGSRLTNWVGILSQGLRIAPPEAPSTGYMFGKGVYFADMSSKSTNYCFPSRTKQTGLVLLCEVSLGKKRELLAADYKADRLTDGCNSVKGMGKIAPDPEKTYAMEDGTIVPLGKGGETGVRNPNGFTLNYNEFVVYDTKQIRMRYLLKVKFNFK